MHAENNIILNNYVAIASQNHKVTATDIIDIHTYVHGIVILCITLLKQCM